MCACIWAFHVMAQNERHINKFKLTSPNGEIRLHLTLSDKIYYNIHVQEELLLEHGVLQLHLDKQVLGENPKLLKKKSQQIDETFRPVVPFKFSTIRNHYNQLILKFQGNYSVEFRAFDDGIAYRFITDKKGEIKVKNELFHIEFPADYQMHIQQSPYFGSSYEEAYEHPKYSEWKSSKKLTLLPVLMEAKSPYKILLSETDLSDYPAMFLVPDTHAGMSAIFPQEPLEYAPHDDRGLKITKRAEYIAKTSGKRNFPWRYFVITQKDGELIENTMTARLAAKNCIPDSSWIKPGVTTWEWWNGGVPFGTDVNFVAGCNTETYKYYIDFASKLGIEYILLDEGWAKSTYDPYTPNANLDLHEVIRYGKEKNVDIILWLTWLCVENHFELFAKYAEWGVKGVKIDFMNRSDQWMVNYYERVAAEAAKHKLFVDFHGSFKPAGLEYKYPNILSYEGVLGMEQMERCHPDNSLFLPFIRNAVGPMDYTPGAMLNYQPKQGHRPIRPTAGSYGTRAYQMALYVIFETGIQMMADNPALYYREEECARFMADVPIPTDETIALKAKAGEYVIVAKRKGNLWYIGGITNGKEKERIFDIPLDFLPEGKKWKMVAYEDGPNANQQAMHYLKREQKVQRGDSIRIKMACNGGYAAVLSAE